MQPKVDSLKVQFIKSIMSAESLYDSVKKLEGINISSRIHPEHVRRVKELAFLGVIASWEDFLEQTFIRYLMGAVSPVGYAPSLRLGRASSIVHAQQILAGDSTYRPTTDYLRFTEPKWVMSIAEIYFHGGKPYTTVLRDKSDLLKNAAKLRNRVAHVSGKARNEFKDVVKYFTSKGTTQGYRVGDLLFEEAVRHFGNSAKDRHLTIFQAYMEMFKALSDGIAP